jgi:hypothetical protein
MGVLMITKEEMLSGVVKVNDERIGSKDPEVRSTSEVSGDGGSGGNTPSGVAGGHALPASAAVPTGEESLQEFVTRRAAEVVDKLAELTDALTDAEGTVRRIKEQRSKLKAELKQLEKISAGTSSM